MRTHILYLNPLRCVVEGDVAVVRVPQEVLSVVHPGATEPRGDLESGHFNRVSLKTN